MAKRESPRAHHRQESSHEQLSCSTLLYKRLFVPVPVHAASDHQLCPRNRFAFDCNIVYERSPIAKKFFDMRFSDAARADIQLADTRTEDRMFAYLDLALQAGAVMMTDRELMHRLDMLLLVSRRAVNAFLSVDSQIIISTSLGRFCEGIVVEMRDDRFEES
jgi:hypothetical protein